jgi:hypothetical protein
MSTPPRTARESVCPPAPKRPSHEEYIEEQTARRGRQAAAREMMMEETTHKLAYLKKLRDLAEKTSCGSDKVKSEMMSYFKTQIQELETDVMGKPRYSYNLHYPTDVGFAPNGRPPVFSDKNFTSIAEMSKFISEYVKENDLMFDKDTYNIPTTKMLESMFQDNDKKSNSTPLEIDINDEDEDEDEEKAPLFTVFRTRVNY